MQVWLRGLPLTAPHPAGTAAGLARTFVAATGTVITIGVPAFVPAATVAKVGVFRPITRLGEDRDYILDLLLAHTTAGLPYEQCVGVPHRCVEIRLRAGTAIRRCAGPDATYVGQFRDEKFVVRQLLRHSFATNELLYVE